MTIKVLHLCTHDIKGGAATAAYRLHAALNTTEASSQMLVAKKDSFDPQVFTPRSRTMRLKVDFAYRGDRWPLKFYRHRTTYDWNIGWFPNGIVSEIERYPSDIIHLHWTALGFIPIGALRRLRRPIVWTQYDMAGFTGGCHYSGVCKRYEGACGACPMLGSQQEFDLSRQTWRSKARAWADLPLTIVTSSRWLTDCAKASSLFRNQRIERIPSGVDINRYKPQDKVAARNLFGLPQDKKLILFVAMRALTDQRKGIQYLIPALKQLAARWQGEAELVILGAVKSKDAPDFGLPAHYMGYLHDEVSMTLLYSAADVFVAPSVQDNLPNTVGEALACGTPCIAFDIGGLPDMLNHQQNGYLVRPFEVDDLAAGIHWVLEDNERRAALAAQARQTAEERFDISKIAAQYVALYDDILNAGASNLP